MSGRIADLLARARTEIEAAGVLASSGFELQSISRAYYAAFYAAEAALLSLGETRSKHSGVVSAFGQLVVKEGGLDERQGSELRRLFELRNAADYSWLDTAETTGDDAVLAARAFVDSVEQWLESRGA
jgi:uncharacterized protein (UPF0332 family)